MIKNKNKLLLGLGIVIFILGVTIAVLSAMGDFYRYHAFGFDILPKIIFCLIPLLIRVGGIGLIAYSCIRSKPKLLCIGYFGIYGVVLSFTNLIIISIMNMLGGSSFWGAFLNGIYSIPNIIFIAIIGLTFIIFNSKESTQKPVEIHNQEPIISTDINEKIEQVNKLHSLLEIGAITQEEFDAKKKQIFNI